MAGKWGVEPNRLMATLKATAFNLGDGKEVTNEQMMMLLVVSNEYGLNPFTRQIYAFPQGGGIVPVVGIDGWSAIINNHPEHDGLEFVDNDDSCQCIIYRKDRAHPVKVTEYLSECKKETAPWKSHPKRMLRHKALIQCARLAYGLTGIYDHDEAERIIDGDVVPTSTSEGSIVEGIISES